MSRFVAAVDLGSSKIAAAAALVDGAKPSEFLALENVPSRGITGGEIADMEKVTADIRSVMARLQESSGKRIKSFFVSIRGGDQGVDVSRGMIPLSRTPREITSRDCEKCLDVASIINVPLHRSVIQKIIRGFYIDAGGVVIRNPVGLYGVKLEAEAFIATIKQSKADTISKCVDNAGFLLDGIYLASLASAESVLSESEKENGVLLLDIGDSVTEALFFKNGLLQDFNVIKKGAYGILREERKERFTQPAFHKLRRMAASAGGDICSTVVTGGGSLIDGIIEDLESALGMRARVGIVRRSGDKLNSRDAIIHAATIGLISQFAKKQDTFSARKNALNRVFHRILEIYESYF